MLQAAGDARHVLLADSAQTIPIALAQLTRDERAAFDRLVEVVEVRTDSVLVRRNRRHNVGRCVVAGWSISVPPAFDPSVLLNLVLYAYRLDLRLAQRAPLISAPLVPTSSLDLFLRMMAAILVSQARDISVRHVAQAWEPIIERSHNLKGKVLWERDFGRHPGVGVSHLHRVKTTDIRPNQLILAGVRAARTLLAGTQLQGDANRQAFVWREVASEMRPDRVAFELGLTGLNRMTEHYRTGLVLSRALVLGLTPVDYFASDGASKLPALLFSLPSIFERFMERLLTEVAAARPDLTVHAQTPDRSALVDERGRTYREVRPDLELLVDGMPAAVIDAKFKPQYASGKGADKLSTADIYQLLFYQARIAQRAGGLDVPAAIVAPQLDLEGLPEGWPRHAVWRQGPGPAQGVRVVPLPLRPVLQLLMEGPASEALDAAPELRSFLELAWLGRGGRLRH